MPSLYPCLNIHTQLNTVDSLSVEHLLVKFCGTGTGSKSQNFTEDVGLTGN